MNSLPHVQRTCASTYSGWMPDFIAPLSLATRGGATGVVLVAAERQGVVPAVVVVDLIVRVGGDGDRVRRAGGTDEPHLDLSVRGKARHRAVLGGRAIRETDIERASGGRSAVTDHCDVCVRPLVADGLSVARLDKQVRTQLRLEASVAHQRLPGEHLPVRDPAEAHLKAVCRRSGKVVHGLVDAPFVLRLGAETLRCVLPLAEVTRADLRPRSAGRLLQ